MCDVPVDQMSHRELDEFIIAAMPMPEREFYWTTPCTCTGHAMECLQLLATEGREVRWKFKIRSPYYIGYVGKDMLCEIENYPDSLVRTVLVEHKESNPSLPLAIARCVAWALQQEAKWRKESEADNV